MDRHVLVVGGARCASLVSAVIGTLVCAQEARGSADADATALCAALAAASTTHAAPLDLLLPDDGTATSAPGDSGAQAPAAPQSAAETLAPRFGAQNSLRLAFEGDWIHSFSGSNQVQARIGLQWFFFENVELAMFGTLNEVWQPGGDAFGGGFDMQLRWHFLAEDTWSVFGEIGGGILCTTDPVPSNGSSFNFTPNVGIGGTVALNDSTRLYMGVRWFHISNAGLYAKNPGRENMSVWLGLSFSL
jgi:hypothetical protein